MTREADEHAPTISVRAPARGGIAAFFGLAAPFFKVHDLDHWTEKKIASWLKGQSVPWPGLRKQAGGGGGGEEEA